MFHIYNSGEIKKNINQKDNNDKISVVVVSHRQQKIGLIIDEIIGKQEIVLKPLERHYKAIKGISGAAILGDGRIVLIIDVIGLMNILPEIGNELSEVAKQNRLQNNINRQNLNENKEFKRKNENKVEKKERIEDKAEKEKIVSKKTDSPGKKKEKEKLKK